MDDTDILSAVQSGDIEILKSYLDEGKDYNVKDDNGWSLIHHAAHTGRFECASLILERAKLDYKSETEVVKNLLIPTDNSLRWKWQSPLALAVSAGHGRVVELFADLYNTSGLIYEKMGFLLRIACQRFRNNCIEILVKKMPQSVNRVLDDTRQNYGPIHITVQERNVEGTKILIENGCDVNMKCTSNRTPLHIAVTGGNYKMVKLLAENVSDINACDIDDYTPLFLASEKGIDKLVQCLLDNGADETKIYGGRKKPAVIHAALRGKNNLLKDLFSKGYPTFDSDTVLFGKKVWVSVLGRCPHDKISETVKILLDNETKFHSLAKKERQVRSNLIRTDIYFLPRIFATTEPEVLTQFLAAGILELRFDCKTFPKTSSIIKRHRKLSRQINSDITIAGVLTCLKYFPFLMWSHENPLESDNFQVGDLVENVPSLLNLTRWTIRCLIIKNNGMIHQKYVKSLKLPKKITEFLAKC